MNEVVRAEPFGAENSARRNLLGINAIGLARIVRKE